MLVKRSIVLPTSIYRRVNLRQKVPQPQKIATKGFSTAFCSIRCPEQHTKNLRKSIFRKGVIFKMASKMAAVALDLQ